MDKKSLKNLIIIFLIIFIVGFSGLVAYYFIYSYQTENRKNNNLDNIIKNQEKTLEDLVKENESSLKSTKNNDNSKKDAEDINTIEDYKNYVNEQLSIVSKENEEEINVIYNQVIQKIRIAAIAFNFDEVANLANEALSKYVFEDGYKYGTLSNLGMLYGLNEMSDLDKFDILGMINEPVVYVSIFYSMSPEYQSERLRNEEYIYVPINEFNQPTLMSVEEGGALESRASEYFSDLTKCEIIKVKIKVAEVPYYVYIVGMEGYSYTITNIEIGDKNTDTRTTYSDYFKIWGKEDVKLPQD